MLASVRLSQIRAWIGRYWLALVMAGGFFISGLLWILPQNPSFPYTYPLILPMYIAFWSLGGLAVPALGIYDTLPFTVRTYRFTAHLTPNQADLPLMLAFLAFISLVLGFIVWTLLKTTRFRIAFHFLVYGNFLLGIGITLLMLLGGTFRSSATENYELRSTCDYSISETTRIREANYDSKPEQYRDIAGIPVFYGVTYLVSHNGGETWHQFLHLALWGSRCDDYGVLTESFFWFWEYSALFTTHDGGHTWRMWNAHQLGDDFARSSGSERADSYIESIRFTDENHGQMQLAYFDHATQTRPTINLTSTDGGLTWQFD